MRIIETGNKILTGDNHPSLQIGQKLYVVDDRKSTWDKIQEIRVDETKTDAQKNDEILVLALGKEAVEEICNDEITVQGYNNLTFYVMAAITGEEYDTLIEKAKDAKN